MTDDTAYHRRGRRLARFYTLIVQLSMVLSGENQRPEKRSKKAQLSLFDPRTQDIEKARKKLNRSLEHYYTLARAHASINLENVL